MTPRPVTVLARGGYTATGVIERVTDTALMLRVRTTVEAIRLDAITTITPGRT